MRIIIIIKHLLYDLFLTKDSYFRKFRNYQKRNDSYHYNNNNSNKNNDNITDESNNSNRNDYGYITITSKETDVFYEMLQVRNTGVIYFVLLKTMNSCE